MKSIKVKELMIPIESYATVHQDATLLEAVLALERSQQSLDPSMHKHRAVLVLNERGKEVSKITMKDILIALEPNYGKIEGSDILSRSGYSPGLIQSMLEDNALWMEPLQFFRERANRLKVNMLIRPPSESEYIDYNAALGEAIHQLVVCPYLSLLVIRGDDIMGILRLSDVFSKICEIIKTN